MPAEHPEREELQVQYARYCGAFSVHVETLLMHPEDGEARKRAAKALLKYWADTGSPADPLIPFIRKIVEAA